MDFLERVTTDRVNMFSPTVYFALTIEPEKWLSTEGIRMDVLILKKDPSLVLDFDIGRIFRGHNILEYKRPDDKLNIDVFAKVRDRRKVSGSVLCDRTESFSHPDSRGKAAGSKGICDVPGAHTGSKR